LATISVGLVGDAGLATSIGVVDQEAAKTLPRAVLAADIVALRPVSLV
jgi:hypothetical protein